MKEVIILDNNISDAVDLQVKINNYLDKIGWKYYIDIYTDPIIFLDLIKNKKCQPFAILISFELSLDDKNSVCLAKKISTCIPEVYIVFTTCDEQKLIPEVYNTRHVYTVAKTQIDRYIPYIIRKIIFLEKRKRKKIVINFGGEINTFSVEDILYIEHKNRHTYYVTIHGIYESNDRMDELENTLPQSCFIRCHKSFIVNVFFVKNYSREELILEEETIPISRKYQPIVRKKYMSWLEEMKACF